MKLSILTESDFLKTTWSGGTTTEIAIAPNGAQYAARDFLWRLSRATVEIERSDFTPLSDYHRLLCVAQGQMTLSHNGGEPITLEQGQVHAFDGGWDTVSFGTCTDLGLMYRKGQCDATMQTLCFEKGAQHHISCADQRQTILCYLLTGQGAFLTADEKFDMQAGHCARLEHGQETTFHCTEDAQCVMMRIMTQ